MNWPQFLTKYSIEYVDSGHNVGRGNIAINCCWCDDPSHHLCISLEDRGYNCWRCSNRGRNPIKLIQKLIHCSLEEAQRIAGITTIPTSADQDMTAYVNQLLNPTETPKMDTKIEFPTDIRPLYNEGWTSPLCMEYMTKRGYTPKEALECAKLYNLHYAISGPFAWRIIFPIYDEHGDLVTWTGRAIGNSIIRYRTLSPNPGKAEKDKLPQALASLKECIWNQNLLFYKSCKALVITEGPFDAMRVDLFGRNYGICGTCTFGKQITNNQIAHLGLSLADEYWLVLDADAELDYAKTLDRLTHLNCKIKRLPKGIKDPAGLSKKQFMEWANLTE